MTNHLTNLGGRLFVGTRRPPSVVIYDTSNGSVVQVRMLCLAYNHNYNDAHAHDHAHLAPTSTLALNLYHRAGGAMRGR